jgi:uncharacterized protein YlxW (UPF0749 family)
MAAERKTGTTKRTGAARAMADPPVQARMGLLNYITAHSLDEDYAHVAHREAVQRKSSRTGPGQNRSGAAALLIMGLFGVLVATAGVQTSRSAVASADGRQELVTQIQARSAQVDARRERITSLREELDSLRSQYLDATARGRAMSTRLDRLGTRSGSFAVRGPGVKVVVDDAPDASRALERVLDKDLQKLVNGLWLSGAEAISINGQRLTNLTAIRHAGSAITVNYRSLSRPYTVSAIGNPDTMEARFVETTHGAEWLDLQVTYGLQLDITTEESLKVPAADRLNLRYAKLPGNRR